MKKKKNYMISSQFIIGVLHLDQCYGYLKVTRNRKDKPALQNVYTCIYIKLFIWVKLKHTRLTMAGKIIDHKFEA